MNVVAVGTFIACLAFFVATIFRGIGLEMLFNPNALLIVIGGTTTALFVGFPVKRIIATLNNIIETFREGSSREILAKEIVEVARIYRKHDVRGLERRARTTGDPFLKLGITLLANHYKNEDIRAVMERETAIRIIDLNSSQNVLKTLARLAPSFGLAGTVISLIGMFKNFHSFETMTPLMAVALMSTFYGVVASSLLFLPLSAKLKEHATSTETFMYMTIEGIIAVNNGEYPLRIEEKILGYCGAAEDGPTRNVPILPSLRNAN
ncbi:MAG: MotA/TolQ/ExbB proton channel family protein [Nitrospirota bacterium]